MTNKTETTIEGVAAKLASWLTDPNFMKQHIMQALTEAYKRGRRDGLEEILLIVQSAHDNLDRSISCQDHDQQWNDQAIFLGVLLDKIRALKEKEQT